MKTLRLLALFFGMYCLLANEAQSQTSTGRATATIVSNSSFEKDSDMFFSIPLNQKQHPVLFEAKVRTQLNEEVFVMNPNEKISTSTFSISDDENFTFALSFNSPAQILVEPSGKIIAKAFNCIQTKVSDTKTSIEIGATLLVNGSLTTKRFYSDQLELAVNYN